MSVTRMLSAEPNAAVALPSPGWALDTPEAQAHFTDCEGSGPDALLTSHFQVSGLYCVGCSGLIEAALMRLPGVVGASVNGSSLHALVRWRAGQVTPSSMVAAIQAAGYDAAPDLAVSARGLRQREQRQALWCLFVAGFCMMQIMMYATPAYVAEPGEMSQDIQRLLQWASWVLALPVLLFSSGPFFKAAWRSLLQKRISMDVPVALGLLVTFVASSGATFDPGSVWGREVYFDSLSMFVFFLLAGRYVAMKLRHRMAARLESLVACWPEVVQRLDDQDHVTLVSPQALRPLDRVRVLVGQAFPADGVILQGETQADEALLNGESLPEPKPQGADVIAGSINLQAPVVVRVERVGSDTRLEGIKALIRQALTQRPRVMQLADQWAGVFLWAVLALALLGGWVWWWIEPARAIWVAVSVLIVTCPCALSLAAPSTWLSAAGALARRGMLLNRFESLEPLSQVTQFIFDKTGTLTEDRMVLKGSWWVGPSADGVETIDALRLRAAALATNSCHPLSKALAASLGQDVGQSTQWRDVREVPGNGLQAEDDRGLIWRLGSLSWVAAGSHPSEPQVCEAAGRGLWFGPLGSACLCFEFEELLRADAKQAVGELQAAGIQVMILSGDKPERVAQVAAQLGIRDFQGGATPQEKLDVVTRAQRGGHRVAVVGDGLNDAPVLARADVSFSVAHGAGVQVTQAHASADAVLLSQCLTDVVHARRTACKALGIARQNMFWAVAYNLVCIPLALSGHLPPWAAGLGMALSSMGVVLNAQRVARGA